jgi:hypothetical protein
MALHEKSGDRSATRGLKVTDPFRFPQGIAEAEAEPGEILNPGSHIP